MIKIRPDCIRRPANPTPRTYVPPNSNPRKLEDTDNWWSLARAFNWGDDPWKLIRFNYPNLPADLRSAALEVNWYLQEYVGCRKVTDDRRNYKFSASDVPGIIHVPSLLPDEIPKIVRPTPKKPFSQWTTEEKLEEAFRRTLPLLPGELREELASLLTPETIAVVAAVLVIWGASHFIGVGEIVDVILLITGGVMLGVTALDVGKDLFAFGSKSTGTKTEADLDEAAEHLANAIAVGGVNVVMAVLLKRSPKALRGPGAPKQKAPPMKPGDWFYKPKIVFKGTLKAGAGNTSRFGDIEVSTKGGADVKKITEIHEAVHSFMTPKFRFLREFRCEARMNSYKKSYFVRYMEEALAETVAQVRVHGLGNIFSGLRFPVKNGYVTVAQLAEEARGIAMFPVNVGGAIYRVLLSEGD